MIKKGYHYIVDCDTKGCDLSYVVGTARHNFDARRQAKQKIIKEGWTPGQVGTIECPECKLKRENKNVDTQAKTEAETTEAVREETVQAIREAKTGGVEAIKALQEVRGV